MLALTGFGRGAIIASEGNMKNKAYYFVLWSCLLLLGLLGCGVEGNKPPQSIVAAPMLSPAAGTYSSALDIAITTTTSGATIRYTTDGSAPTPSSGTVYTAPVHIADTLTLKAVAYRTGWTTSSVASGEYTIAPLVSAPVFSPGPGTYAAAQEIIIITTTAGAAIRFTTDGSRPTDTNGILYVNPVHISETLTLKAAAYRSGWTTSPVTSGQYMIGPLVTAPEFNPGPGTFADPQDITISTPTPGAIIRYTTDGSTPTDTIGILYTAPVHIAESLALKAIAYRQGWRTSSVTSGEYTIGFHVAAPQFNPAPGTYESAQDVAITTSTSGATIRYTMDGTTPTDTIGAVYSAPVHISETLSLKAVAYRGGWTTSSVTTAQFTIEPPEPVYKHYAYVANSESHTISAFTIDPITGTLTAIEGSPFAAGGAYPWSVAVHPSGRFLYVLNYLTRDISILSISASTGALAAISSSPIQTGGPYPAWIAIEPTGKFLYVADSVINGVMAFAINEITGALTPFYGSPFSTGISPASVAIDPSGKFAYVANAGSHSISAFTVDAATGILTPVASSPFSAGGLSPTTVGVDPSGKYVYVTNGASDNISAFAINPTSGALTIIPGSPFAAGGTAPVFVGVDPTSKFAYVVNAGSTISAFSIVAATGVLTAVSGSPFDAGGNYPRAIAFEHTGKFAYVANSYSGTVSAFAINATTGALTAISGSPFSTGIGPYSLVTVRIAQ
jgi:6-phosphogluconolactonase